MKRIYVIPTTPTVIVRDPITLHPIPVEGKEVPENSYWLRRVKDGAVTLSAPPRTTPGKVKHPKAKEED